MSVSENLKLPAKLPPKFAISGTAHVAEFLDELIPAAFLLDDVPNTFSITQSIPTTPPT